MKKPLALILGLALLLGAPAAAQAQANRTSNQKLSELLPNLYLDNLFADAVGLDVFFFPGAFDIVLDARGEDFLAPPRTLTQLIATQLTSFPLGSAAGGFSWTFDPALGTFNRVSSSFGSSFVERGLTIGRRKFNFGMNYQRATFDKVEGRDLRDGGIKVYAGITCADLGLSCNEAVFIEESLDMKLSASTVGFFATYGVTSRLDLGVAIPLVRVEMDASLTTRVGLRSTGLLPDSNPFVDQRSGDASGIGDVVVRGKYNFWSRPGAKVAAGVDWRLPTGDEEELLGVAGAQGKFFLAASSEQGRVSPHVNLGFTISGDTEAGRSDDTFVFTPPDEFNYAGGLDFAATPRLTVSGDIIGRNLRDAGGLMEVASDFRSDIQEFRRRDGNLNLMLGALSVKYNVFGKALLAGNILVPLNATGLYDKLTWALGFEYSF